MAIQDTDFFLVTTANKFSYKIPASALSSSSGDLIVNRGSNSYKCDIDDVSSKVLDDDYLIINRGSSSYRTLGSEVKSLFGGGHGGDFLFEGLDFSAVGDSFMFPDGTNGNNRRYAFCLGREADYSYTSPNVIWCAVSDVKFAKFELQGGVFTKVGNDIDTGLTDESLFDITDTGTHIIILSNRGTVNRYNKSTESQEIAVAAVQDLRGVAWKNPFFYTGSDTTRPSIFVFSDQSNNTEYTSIVSNNTSAKGLAYDPEDGLFYQCFDKGGGTIFSTTNSSSNTNSVSFTVEGTLPSWNKPGNMLSYDILSNSNGKFIIGKDRSSGEIYCLYQLA